MKAAATRVIDYVRGECSGRNHGRWVKMRGWMTGLPAVFDAMLIQKYDPAAFSPAWYIV